MRLQKRLPELKTTAEGEGFEPPVGCPTAVFKTAALNRTRPSLRAERQSTGALMDLKGVASAGSP
jgi:hypothetical protein